MRQHQRVLSETLAAQCLLGKCPKSESRWHCLWIYSRSMVTFEEGTSRRIMWWLASR